MVQMIVMANSFLPVIVVNFFEKAKWFLLESSYLNLGLLFKLAFDKFLPGKG